MVIFIGMMTGAIKHILCNAGWHHYSVRKVEDLGSPGPVTVINGATSYTFTTNTKLYRSRRMCAWCGHIKDVWYDEHVNF